MSRSTSVLLAALAVATGAFASGPYPGIGRTATPAEIAAWDIDVRPDFKGLPKGSGSVARGQDVWDAKCASCHGTFGESNEVFTPLVGGTTREDIATGRVKGLVSGDVARTAMMKLSTLSTLWDYINRAMPWNAPKSLSTDEVYAVVAYMLNLADVLPGDFVLSDRNMAEVQAKLPNRNGVTRNHGMWDVGGKPDVKNVACMKDCATETKLASFLPDFAKGAHGNLAEQNRPVGGVRGANTSTDAQAPLAQVAKAAAASDIADLARRKACLSCHGVDKKIVGPAFTDVAARYKGDPGAQARLVEKLKRGGSGAWGPIPMPPNPDLPEADASALITWVLGGAH
jgi:S-disulfanyl-L-cysteine oxidoreductase SoxD